MAELGSGSGTGYPTVLDTDTTVEANEGESTPTLDRAECINDANAAIVAIETELGTDPSSGYASVSARLDAVDIPSRNLIIKQASNTTVDIDATHIIVEGFRKASLNLTVDITASGANGLDTGSEANSTWYYVWVICNPSTLAFAGLLSTSATAPTMPTGYTEKRLVSYAYNGSDGHIRAFTHIGDVYQYTASQLILNDGAETSATEIDLSAYVPTGIKGIFGTGFASGNVHVYIHTVTFTPGATTSVSRFSPSAANFGFEFHIPLLTVDQSIFYAVSGSTADLNLWGFTTREAY